MEAFFTCFSGDFRTSGCVGASRFVSATCRRRVGAVGKGPSKPSPRLCPAPPGVTRSAVKVVRSAVTVVRNAVTVVGNAVTVVGNAVTVVRNAVTVVRNAVTVVGNAVTVVRNAVTVAGNAVTVVRNAVTVVRNVVTVLRNAVTVVRWAPGLLRALGLAFKPKVVEGLAPSWVGGRGRDLHNGPVDPWCGIQSSSQAGPSAHPGRPHRVPDGILWTAPTKAAGSPPDLLPSAA